ncbi:hypothetical protein [Aquiflexum lacus]|uniref:hypothetical protein n=1 Tax=Aquiflexum lacus TaxID=2483805 RepID=UPI00189316AA|nr:hypothetical protein [Aquiflexum lacus]
MYVRNNASKMVIQYNSHKETDMSGPSLPTEQAGVLFVIEYWVTGKEVNKYYFLFQKTF